MAVPAIATGGLPNKVLPRLAIWLLLQTNLLAFSALSAIVGSYTFALGIFHAANPVFFPLYSYSSMRETLLIALPALVFCLLTLPICIFVASRVTRFTVGEIKKPKSPLVRSMLAIGLPTLALYVVQLMLGSLASFLLLAAFYPLWLVIGSYSIIYGAGTIYTKILSVAKFAFGCFLLLLISMFVLGFAQTRLAIDDFSSFVAYGPIDGRMIRVVVLFPDPDRPLYYDGHFVRVASPGFIERVVVRPPEFK